MRRQRRPMLSAEEWGVIAGELKTATAALERADKAMRKTQSKAQYRSMLAASCNLITARLRAGSFCEIDQGHEVAKELFWKGWPQW